MKVPNNAFASSFVLKSENPATETYQLLQQAYGEDAMGRTRVFDWLRRFKESRTSVESDIRSGRLFFLFRGYRTPRVRFRRANNCQGILRGGLATFA